MPGCGSTTPLVYPVFSAVQLNGAPEGIREQLAMRFAGKRRLPAREDESQP